ncbi:hypothetical protein A3F66_03865 [candidate division TM6 bacterium RIFCSPHIGHO2_12_FULL_32_22]|nr:MAG: hypothetical protein A3F66_03865 [candidate division TM6 bacterium RIFCSPHIGHO2_12_FULL_32_22]
MKKFPKILILGLIWAQGLTAQDIYITTASGDPQAIDAALQAGADINATTPEGITPLIIAILRNNLYIVNFLLKRGANPNTPYAKIESYPLRNALKKLVDPTQKYYQQLNIQIVDSLLDNGAKISGYDLTMALELGDKNLVEKMLSKNPSPRILTEALLNIQNITIENLELLAKHRAFINIRDSEGTTVLDSAVEQLNVDVVKWLLEHGANPNVEHYMDRRTPLINAAMKIASYSGSSAQDRFHKSEEVFKLLLKHGADAQAIDGYNKAVIDYLPATGPFRDLLRSYYTGESDS